MRREDGFLRWLADRVPTGPEVRRGVGDDAAWLAAPGGDYVIAVDAVLEGTHFRLAEAGGRAVGRKALAVNLSDLAAVGARPVAGLVAVSLPRAGPDGLAEELLEGLCGMARAAGCAVVGGDTCVWEGPLSIAVTVTGALDGRRPLSRKGARPGHVLAVTGALGGSLLGRHLSFEPRLAAGVALASRHEVGACMDVSDGLAIDLARMAEASGVGAEVDAERVPIHPDARRAAAASGREALDHALSDGEDFELLFTAPEAAWPAIEADGGLGAPVTRIGRIVADPGLVLVDGAGDRRVMPRAGWEHAWGDGGGDRGRP